MGLELLINYFALDIDSNTYPISRTSKSTSVKEEYYL